MVSNADWYSSVTDNYNHGFWGNIMAPHHALKAFMIHAPMDGKSLLRELSMD